MASAREQAVAAATETTRAFWAGERFPEGIHLAVVDAVSNVWEALLEDQKKAAARTVAELEAQRRMWRTLFEEQERLLAQRDVLWSSLAALTEAIQRHLLMPTRSRGAGELSEAYNQARDALEGCL